MDLRIDERVFETLKIGLKESFQDEKAYRERMVANLTAQQTTLSNHLSQLYLDGASTLSRDN